MILGVDPGHSGGAVLLDSDGVVKKAYVWEKTYRKNRPPYSAYCLKPGGFCRDGEHLRLADVLMRWSLEGSVRVAAVEQTFSGRMSPPTAVKLGEASGQCVFRALMGSAGCCLMYRPYPASWRSRMLPGASRSSYDRVSYERLPHEQFGDHSMLKPSLWTHVADAYWIAKYAEAESTQEAGPGEL